MSWELMMNVIKKFEVKSNDAVRSDTNEEYGIMSDKFMILTCCAVKTDVYV